MYLVYYAGSAGRDHASAFYRLMVWALKIFLVPTKAKKNNLLIKYIKQTMNLFSTKCKLIFLILGFYLISVTVFSQNLVFNNIKSLNLINQSVIKNGDDVKGYFFIYEKDTIDNYIDTYKFTITDKKLQVIKETDIKVSEETSIFETSSNGSEIILLFFHADEKTFEYQIYDLNGLKKFTYLRNLSGKELRQYKKIALSGADNIDSKSFYPIDDVGFISKTMRIDKSINSISIDFYSTKENMQWSYVPITGGSYFFGEYLGMYKNVVYLQVTSFKGSIYTDKPEIFIVGLDLKTGKELFKKPADSKNKILPKGLKILNDGNGYLYGAYYNVNADVNKDKAIGFALWKIKEDGSVIDEKYITWDNGFNDYLNISSKGRIQGVGYIHFHNIVQMLSGDLYVLGEGYDKALNATTVFTMAFLGFSPGGKGFLKKVNTDMILIKLDSTYKVKDVTIYDKKNSDFFGYNGTQTNSRDSSFSFWYLSNKEDLFNTINVYEDKIIADKIKINVQTSSSLVLPAHNRLVLLVEYFKSEKIMKLHFEAALNK